MDIQKVEIKFFALGSFDGEGYENVRHKKILPWLSVVQSQEGNYDIGLGNRSLKNTGEGGFFIAPSGVQQDIVHHVNPESRIMCARWLFIDALIDESVGFDSVYDFPVILPDKYRNELDSVFDLLFSTVDIYEKYACCYKVLKILQDASKLNLKKSDKTMLAAYKYIRENYMYEIRVKDVAKFVNMSESNFFAVFKKHFGISPIAYINKFRISIAEEKLKNTNDTITDIATSVGIRDPFYFNRLFHKNYHTAPRTYRIKH